jgi:hypothetical protein
LLPVYRLYNLGLPLAGGRHSSVYGNDEQRRHADKDAVLCFDNQPRGRRILDELEDDPLPRIC